MKSCCRNKLWAADAMKYISFKTYISNKTLEKSRSKD